MFRPPEAEPGERLAANHGSMVLLPGKVQGEVQVPQQREIEELGVEHAGEGGPEGQARQLRHRRQPIDGFQEVVVVQFRQVQVPVRQTQVWCVVVCSVLYIHCSRVGEEREHSEHWRGIVWVEVRIVGEYGIVKQSMS